FCSLVGGQGVNKRTMISKSSLVVAAREIHALAACGLGVPAHRAHGEGTPPISTACSLARGPPAHVLAPPPAVSHSGAALLLQHRPEQRLHRSASTPVDARSRATIKGFRAPHRHLDLFRE